MQGVLSRRNDYYRPEKQRVCDSDRIDRLCQVQNGKVIEIMTSKTATD